MGKGARKLPLLSKEACERYLSEEIAEKESQCRDVFSGPGDGGGECTEELRTCFVVTVDRFSKILV